MVSFEDLINKHILSDVSILERVDEYTLYCKYLGYEPMLSTKYSSPIRTADEDPSFSIYDSRKQDREFFWKDNGAGEGGDIFKLIKLIYGYTSTKDVYKRVDIDFKLGFTDGVKPPEGKIIEHVLGSRRPDTKIRIHSKHFTVEDLKYWAQFGITYKTLIIFKVKSVKYYWLHDFQDIPTKPRGLAFAYEILTKYKIYQPFMPMYKFRNDYTEQCLGGFAQLKYVSDTLIITKSEKDVMTLFELGYESVCARSENTLIPEPFLRHFHFKYKRILILFDNDMKHKGDSYQEPKVYIPVDRLGTKDISDYRKMYGEQLTRDLLKTIIR